MKKDSSHSSCSCPSTCTCGCQEGGECSCDVMKKDSSHSSCSCPSTCTCGCQEGGECSCSKNSFTYPNEEYDPASWSSFYCFDVCEYEDNTVFLLPGGAPSFLPFKADPRAVEMSAAWRYNDSHHIFEQNVAAVSYGDQATLCRLIRPWGYNGYFDFGIEGALWAFFEILDESAPLVNADYYVGFPFTYVMDDWQFRLRVFHISSHIGDEFLIDHPSFHRRNPSSEYLDLFASWYYNPWLRLYAGLGIILRSDETYRFKKYYAEYGFEQYIPRFASYYNRAEVLGIPYFAAHMRTRADDRYRFDGSFALGYEWSRLGIEEKVLRVFLMAHEGYCFDGQFSRQRNNWYEVGASWGY